MIYTETSTIVSDLDRIVLDGVEVTNGGECEVCSRVVFVPLHILGDDETDELVVQNYATEHAASSACGAQGCTRRVDSEERTSPR